MLQGFLQGLQELVFPDNCFLCRKFLNNHHQSQLCPSCLSTIVLNRPPFCLRCSRQLKTFNAAGLCASCTKAAYSFDAAWAPCLYEGPLPRLLYAFKYYGKTSLKKIFSQLIIDFIATYHVPLENFDMIMPIPLHPTRYRQRGFNQAELLSQEISRYYGLPHRLDLLSRSKLTMSQTTQQDAKQRWTNVEGAFRINLFLDLADKNVLIVDDLLTTAATVQAAAQTLKDAGTAYVGVLTLAITP